ncbi:MAG: restriction endonuclease subunit S [Lachnospiraceae bacterium]|nr:restriction endonuclease subunit S [Lachnospiraceae bacterium]
MVNHNLAYQLAPMPEHEVVIDDAPVKWCTVSLSEIIERGKRLEASVYDVEAKQAREIIAEGKYPLTMLGGKDGLTTSYTCARFKRIWVERSDYPIYQPSAIVDIKPSPDGYISALTDTNIDALRVSKGQVLMTCSGTIGKVSYVSDTLDNLIFSHDLLRINCKNPSDAGYVYTYLKSKAGNKILLTNSYGAVITHIEPEHLASVPIPNAPDEIKSKISDLIVRSYSLRDESNSLIDRATQMLIDELQLPAMDELDVDYLKKDAPVEAFSVKLSGMDYRLDASYHVPIVDAIMNHLKKHAEEVTTIGDSRISKAVVLPGRFKRVYVENEYGVKFLGGKEMNQLDPSSEKYLSKKAHAKQLEGPLGIKENSILTPARGSLGNVVMPCKHFYDWAISDNMMQIISYENICGYVYIFLNSEYGKALIRRFTYGGVVDAIEPWHIQQVQIPLLHNKDVQSKINELALQVNHKRYEAYLLEQKALRIMDEEVLYAK